MWVWSQHWQDVLFLHWPVDPTVLRARLPQSLEIDTYADDAWVSLVLFRLRVRPRWLPFLPGVSDLAEVNLRTYVHCQGKPGIWFLSVHADNRWAIRLARLLTPIPYAHAAMQYERRGNHFQFEAQHPSTSDTLAALTFLPSGKGSSPRKRSLDEWLLERYRLYTGTGSGALAQAEVAHPRWVAQSVALSVKANAFGQAAGLGLPCAPERAHFSSGVSARFGAFQRLEDPSLEPRVPSIAAAQ